MRICVLSDAVFPTPMDGGHGLGLMAWQIAEGLLARGHDVTLVAKAGSQFSGILMPVQAEGYEGEVRLAKVAATIHRDWPFDAFLDHGHLNILSDLYGTWPVVNVFHDVYQHYARCPVLLSFGQQALMRPAFENARIIPNALYPEAFTLNTAPEDYVLFLGALSEIKQPLLAIEACARAAVPLKMAGGGIIGKFPVGGYENVEYLGMVKGSKKFALLRNARVFLQLGYAESFGLTTLEAALSGTPVVAWPVGGNLDIVRYGVNGVFAVAAQDRVQAVADGIRRAWDMNRPIVRQYSERFSDVDAQITAYEDALADCMKGNWW